MSLLRSKGILHLRTAMDKLYRRRSRLRIRGLCDPKDITDLDYAFLFPGHAQHAKARLALCGQERINLSELLQHSVGQVVIAHACLGVNIGDHASSALGQHVDSCPALAFCLCAQGRFCRRGSVEELCGGPAVFFPWREFRVSLGVRGVVDDDVGSKPRDGERGEFFRGPVFAVDGGGYFVGLDIDSAIGRCERRVDRGNEGPLHVAEALGRGHETWVEVLISKHGILPLHRSIRMGGTALSQAWSLPDQPYLLAKVRTQLVIGLL